MEIKKTKYELELTKEEIEMIVKALSCECEYRGEQIMELESYIKDTSNHNSQEDTIKRCELIKEYEPYRKLLGEVGGIIGVFFSGKDY